MFQISEAYRLICSEARLGDNVGSDEFTSEDNLTAYIDESNSFSLSDSQTGELKSFFIITPSLYSRMEEPVLTTPHFFFDQDIMTQIRKAVLQISLHLAADLGYEVGPFFQFLLTPEYKNMFYSVSIVIGLE